ncbi:succinylglutamate desuccinylase [Jeongeupia sp. USM3]|uniref:succinylglutamate desuccinylase n=1 Tax=Jeongeupia sp. USM3 TaxID=1906741 RepID=UPI00089DD980|nr:succinylglutamate desuccinylase [Jeongeupia sp. USM3]AOX99237.1 succinylglutamate desuccinylase [Jeongeupia sp. USM3]
MNSFLAETLAGRTAIALPYCQANGTHVQVLDEGVIRFEPREPEHRVFDVVISCGVHGNETAPVELVDTLISALLSGELRPRARVLFIIGNIEALRRGERFVERDMNRQFCRVPDAGDDAEARRAAMLEMQLGRFFSQGGGAVPRLHYDLHTAIHGSLIEKFAICPLPAQGCDFDQVEIARLGLAGISAVLLQSAAAPTFTLFSSRYCGASAFTVELGRAMPFGQNRGVDLSRLDAYLRGLIEGALPEPPAGGVTVYRVSREVIKHSDAFRLLIDAETDNFTPLPQGMLLAEDGETRWIVDEAGALIVFPNPDVAVGQRAGLIVVPAAPA